jgi:hypothetical protein
VSSRRRRVAGDGDELGPGRYRRPDAGACHIGPRSWLAADRCRRCRHSGFVVGQRRGVDSPGIAFVPFVGAWIVILRSIGRSGWLAVLSVIPLVALGLYIWVAFRVPTEHGRTSWWTLPFLIPGANVVAFWVYAFTLDSTAP